jgi:hypothetical protein
LLLDVALDSGKQVSGFLMEYPDGTVAYWGEPGEQAKLAKNLDAAFEEVFIHRMNSSSAARVAATRFPNARSPPTATKL